uniref:Splicing factor 3B subunit 6 n=1 Tax=Cyprinus carpio TaxID=7962 RepID=A0A8C2PTI7_CYPCA
MAMQAAKRANIRLPPEVNRILYIRNLPYKITAEEMYDIFGKYGPIRQIRVGNTPETRGTAYVVYEDIFDAKNACDHLSGFNVCNRYLVVLYYNANRVSLTVFAFDSNINFMVCETLLPVFFFLSLGFPKNGHKEKGGAAETSQREVRDKHRPTEIVNILLFLLFFYSLLHPYPSHFNPLSDFYYYKKNSVHYLA